MIQHRTEPWTWQILSYHQSRLSHLVNNLSEIQNIQQDPLIQPLIETIYWQKI
jgi:hypothetical protein